MNQDKFNNLLIPYVYWRAKWLSKRLGFAGLIGVSLMLTSLAFYWFEFLPMKQLTLVQKVQVQQQEKTSHLPVLLTVEPTNPQAELANFYASFPNGSQLSSSLKQIQSTAIKHKLILNRGDYKFTLTAMDLQKKINSNTLARYEIQLPVSGSYSQIRAFIEEVMLQLPTLALSEVQMKRESSLVPIVEGRLKFVLFVKGEAWH